MFSRLAVLLVLAALAMVGAGCGGDDESKDQASSEAVIRFRPRPRPVLGGQGRGLERIHRDRPRGRAPGGLRLRRGQGARDRRGQCLVSGPSGDASASLRGGGWDSKSKKLSPTGTTLTAELDNNVYTRHVMLTDGRRLAFSARPGYDRGLLPMSSSPGASIAASSSSTTAPTVALATQRRSAAPAVTGAFTTSARRQKGHRPRSSHGARSREFSVSDPQAVQQRHGAIGSGTAPFARSCPPLLLSHEGRPLRGVADDARCGRAAGVRWRAIGDGAASASRGQQRRGDCSFPCKTEARSFAQRDPGLRIVAWLRARPVDVSPGLA
jgi:hypothetical protein